MMPNHIERRRFLAGLAAAGAAGSVTGNRRAKAAPVEGKQRALKIIDVQVLRLSGKGNTSSNYVKLSTDQGAEGLYGPVDTEAGKFVDWYFASRLKGQDALAHETYWDRMFRSNRHARGSHYLIGLSAVDNALWDLKGRYFGLPVYRLLGGSRDKVRAYASCLGFSQEAAPMQAKARELKAAGYRHQKWFLRNRGPNEGPEGVTKDATVVRLLREAVGDDTDLMFDAFSTWDVNYAVDWARRVEQYRPRWIEEPFPTANIDAFIELSRETSIPIATGEHFYNRWDVHNFLKANAISVVQADPEWCGGVSELTKICTLASVHGAHVIPHGHSLHAAMHVVASQPIQICPLVEYLIGKMQGNWYYFEKHRFEPVKGMIEMPDRPGFGIEFDEAKVTDMRPVHWRQS